MELLEKSDSPTPFHTTFISCPYILQLQANINIHPNTLNLKSKGKWITCFIELPEGSDGNKIDISTIKLDDSIYDCLVREVREESNLDVHAATLFAIWSEPEKMSIVTEYGDPYQLVNFIFRVDAWSGELVKETDETIDAGFFHLYELPKMYPHYHETLDDLRDFETTGKVILK